MLVLLFEKRRLEIGCLTVMLCFLFALKYVLHVDFVSCVCFMRMVLIVFFCGEKETGHQKGGFSHLSNEKEHLLVYCIEGMKYYTVTWGFP